MTHEMKQALLLIGMVAACIAVWPLLPPRRERRSVQPPRDLYVETANYYRLRAGECPSCGTRAVTFARDGFEFDDSVEGVRCKACGQVFHVDEYARLARPVDISELLRVSP